LREEKRRERERNAQLGGCALISRCLLDSPSLYKSSSSPSNSLYSTPNLSNMDENGGDDSPLLVEEKQAFITKNENKMCRTLGNRTGVEEKLSGEEMRVHHGPWCTPRSACGGCCLVPLLVSRMQCFGSCLQPRFLPWIRCIGLISHFCLLS